MVLKITEARKIAKEIRREVFGNKKPITLNRLNSILEKLDK